MFVRSGTTWTEQAHLFASDGADFDSFGNSVALAGDTALVGAYQDNTAGGAGASSGYVFVRSGTTWTEQAHLFASDGAAGDGFGNSVALAGHTALVGAYQDNTAGGAGASSGYVFVRGGTTWTEQTHLFASDGAAGDGFGNSVALAGDTALVGARGDDTAAGAGVGSAYVFVISAGEIIPGRYVALGDSYSSGEGAGNYYADTNTSRTQPRNECHRSRRGWPTLLRNLPNVNGGQLIRGLRSSPNDYWACSGAIIFDLYNPNHDGWVGEPAQLDHLGEDVTLVTITMGGNNLGFPDISRACLEEDDCSVTQEARVASGLLSLRGSLPGVCTGTSSAACLRGRGRW